MKVEALDPDRYDAAIPGLGALLKDAVDGGASVNFLAGVTPAQADPAPKIATETGLTSKEAVMRQFFGLRSHRSPFNLSGVPAMSVPCGFTEAGLPMSIQIAAEPFAENTLFTAGHAYQARTDWHERRPSL